MAKMNRERALKEKRALKQERKDAKKQARLAEDIVAEGELPDQLPAPTDADENGTGELSE